MNRVQTIQAVLDTKGWLTRYLEIGVYRGDTLFAIRSPLKTAVDPSFEYSRRAKLGAYRRNPYNLFNRYFSLTSDAFFQVRGKSQDVIFIDGLHTYEQSLRDVENALAILKDDGVIIMHDCNPPSASASFPAESIEEVVSLNPQGFDGLWCGDVWKTICHLRASRSDLDVFVHDDDCGLGIITKQDARTLIDLPLSQIPALHYEDLVAHRNDWLNIKDENYLRTFISDLDSTKIELK